MRVLESSSAFERSEMPWSSDERHHDGQSATSVVVFHNFPSLILRSSKKPLQKLIIRWPLEKSSKSVAYARGNSYDGVSLPGSLHQDQHDLQPKIGLRKESWRRTLDRRTLDRSMGGFVISCGHRRIALWCSAGRKGSSFPRNMLRKWAHKHKFNFY